MVTRGEGTEDAQTFKRKMERRVPQVVWNDRQTDVSSNKKGNQNKGGSGLHSYVERWRPCGKNGSAETDTSYINLGGTDRRRKSGRPKTLWEFTFNKVAGGKWSLTVKN
jgi:hypothetical protein